MNEDQIKLNQLFADQINNIMDALILTNKRIDSTNDLITELAKALIEIFGLDNAEHKIRAKMSNDLQEALNAARNIPKPE